MQLTEQQLDYYVQNVLSFGPTDKRRHQDQIDNLITKLRRAVNENSSLRVTKILQAGSWRKGTALKPRDGQELDIDLAVYLDASEATKNEITTLHTLIIDLLCAVYPTKSRKDFPPSRKTVGIEFHTSGLWVDLAPMVPVATPEGYVWQPEVGGGGAFLTSPAEQLAFVRAQKDAAPRYASLVRLLKRARHHAELGGTLSSFALELVVAHVTSLHGPAPRLEEGLLRVLHYVAASGLRDPITFPGAIRTCAPTVAPVRIYDPTNNENNATSRIDETGRRAIVTWATDALETLNYAQNVSRKGDTLACWKEVFGPSFRIEDLP